MGWSCEAVGKSQYYISILTSSWGQPYIMSVFILGCVIYVCCEFKLKPFIAVGGFMGSNLDVKLHNAEPHDIFCLKNSDWYQIWINILEDFRYLDIHCFIYNLELHWTPSNMSVEPNVGVKIRPRDFGGIRGMQFYDKNFKMETKYFYDFFEYFEKTYGYIPGINMRGATYDFRLSPKEWILPGGFFSQLKPLIEETYELNGFQKVTLIGHSMGAPAINVFLNDYVDDEWRDKYVYSLVSIAGAWDGGVSALLDEFITQEVPNWLHFLQKYVAELSVYLKSLPGLQWMVPSVKLQDEVVMITKTKNYTMSMYGEMMDDIGRPDIKELYYYANSVLKASQPPGVPTHCVYTEDIPTAIQVYVDDLINPTDGYVTKTVPGDGVVPLLFSEMCFEFKNMQDEEVVIHKISDGKHADMVKLKEVWEIVASIVVGDD